MNFTKQNLRLRQSITTKLILLLLLFGLVPLGVVSIIVWDSGNKLDKKVGKNFERIAVNIGNTIDRNLFDRYGDVQTFTLNTSFLRRIEWYDSSADNSISRTMNALVQQYGIYQLMIMVDVDGKVIAVNNRDMTGQPVDTQFIFDQDYGQASWLQRLKQEDYTMLQPVAGSGKDHLRGIVVEDVHVDQDVKRAYPESDALTLGFSAPVYEDGEVVAFWSNRINFSIVEKIVLEAYQDLKVDEYPGAEITLLDRNGIILIDYDPRRDGRETVVHDMQTVILKYNLAEAGVTIAQQAMAGNTGYLEAMHTRKQIFQKGGYTHLKGFQGFSGMHWSVLVRVPADEATAERDAILNRVWITAAVVVGLLLPFGFFVGRGATRRIKMLESVAEEMAKGDFSSRISDVKHDELSNLGVALNGLGEKSQEVVAKAYAIADGNFALDVDIRGKQDTLGQALQMMIASLREVTEVAQAVCEGDFSLRIRSKGDQDILGKAMNEMVHHFQELAIQVDTVADGNYEVEIVPRSEDDHLGHAFSRMVTQIRDRDRDLKISEAKSQAVVNTAVDGIISIDSHGGVQTYNLAAQKLFGYQANEVIGQNIKMLMPNPYHQEHDGYLSRFRETRVSKIIGVGREVIGKRKDGTTFPLHLSLGEMVVDGIQYFTGIIRDISEENRLKHDLQEQNQRMEQESWLKSMVGTISEMSQGGTDLQAICRGVISALATALGAGYGVLYVKEDRDEELQSSQGNVFHLMGAYAYQARKHVGNRIEIGEGLVGQCAFEKGTILLSNVPADYVPIQSGLGEQVPKQVIVTPVLFEDNVVGVLELATFQEFTDLQRQLLEKVSRNFGVTLNSVFARQQTERLLEQSQSLTLELKSQEEELRTTNEELQVKAEELQRSEEDLRQQSEELQVSNEELQNKSQSLELTNTEIERKNQQIELAQLDLEKKAKALAQASKYKSEFLANMSHELRTPLNSLLILAQTLTDNEEGNLTEEQIESARVIHSGGKDLLHLINDILDLSKVEAGKLSVNVQSVSLDDVCARLHALASPLAKEKGNTWNIDRERDAPTTMITDQQRLEQIIKNLLSNAFKFTSQGSVILRIHRMGQDISLHQAKLQANSTIVFSVVDTGTGIPEEKQGAIFEAFQQADGSTSRNYGGTGLGLTISRELASMLGGEIQLISEAGKGSVFSLYLPYEYGEIPHSPPMELPVNVEQTNVRFTKRRQRSEIREVRGGPLSDRPFSEDHGIKHLLIIEDDPIFGKILQQYGSQQGYVCSWAKTGQEGLRLASTVEPLAILMDMTLPDLSGEDLLATLKQNPSTRHIPVHVISGQDNLSATLTNGAMGYVTKPVDGDVLRQTIQNISQCQGKALPHVLLVEDDPIIQASTCHMIEQQGGAKVAAVGTVEGAMNYLRDSPCDLLITDLRLPDGSGLELLKTLTREQHGSLPPVIVYTAKDLSRDEHQELQEYAACVVVKGGLAPERLLEEVGGIFKTIQMPKTLPLDSITPPPIDPVPLGNSSLLIGRTVLVVDDDIRNVFALSKALKQLGASVVIADGGALALEKLESEPAIDLVLLDIMMPGMDGYETTKHIRQHPIYAEVPIVILSAKTMPDEKAQCLAVGANEYLSKPLDLQLLHRILAGCFTHPVEEPT